MLMCVRHVAFYLLPCNGSRAHTCACFLQLLAKALANDQPGGPITSQQRSLAEVTPTPPSLSLLSCTQTDRLLHKRAYCAL